LKNGKRKVETPIQSQLREDDDVAQLFFLVSGENPTLPFSEIKAILDAEAIPHRVLEGLTQVLRIEASPSCIEHVKFRSAMTRICGMEVFNCGAELEEILENVRKAELSSVIGEGESFTVRISRVRRSTPQIAGTTLEKKIGEIIQKSVQETRVDLKTPAKTLFGVLTDDRFIFGLKAATLRHGEYLERGPRRKIFFHPAAMPVKLARCMVNLAQPREGDLVLDPFCGTGSFLVEAGLMGCRALGFDVKRRMVRGTLRNLSLYGIVPEGLAVADARLVPLSEASVGCIVTDPPYGTSATTLGMETRELFGNFLSNAGDAVEKGRLVCLAAPRTLGVQEVGERSGLKHLESHFIYIHHSLTREVAVFRRE